MMKEFFLPHDFFGENKLIQDVVIYPYISREASTKNRIILDWHLFSFVTDGEKRVTYAAGTRSITNTNFLFLPAGNCLMSERVADNGLYKAILMFVSRKTLTEFFASYKFEQNDIAKTDRLLETEPKAFEKDIYLESFISSLSIIANQNYQQNKTICQLKFQELMVYLLNKDKNLINYFQSFCEEWDEEAQLRKVVNIHAGDSITVEELAFICNMSLSTFKRKFVKIYNDPPKQYLFKMRMQRAADLLKNEGLQASEIYQELGYDNLSSFVQAFKKMYGTTPKQFQLY